MRLNVPMLRRGVHRLIARRAIDIKTLAVEERILCAAETASAPPALYLDGALDNIKALSPWRSWEVERSLIEGHVANHAASRAHVIENVDLVGPFLYKRAARHQPGHGREQVLLHGDHRFVYLKTANMLSNKAGSDFFGNYLLDDFPLGMLGENRDDNIAAPTRVYPHEEGYRDLVNLPRPQRYTYARIGRLTIYTDFAQNSLKASRYRTLRSRLLAKLASTQTRAPSPGVFIRRGRTGEPRILFNEVEVEESLRKIGFDIIEPRQMSAVDIAARTLGVRLIVSVEGSHLSHAIYSVADDAAFLVLQPHNRFAMAYKEFTDRLDMRFAFLVGDPAPEGFSIPVSDLHRMLERLL